MNDTMTITTLEDRIAADLAKFDTNIEKVNELRAEASALVINGLEDKAGYAAVDAMRKRVKKVRTTGENIRKDLVDEAVSYQKRVNGYWKTIETPLVAIEDGLEKKIEAVEQEKERLRQEADMKKRQRIDDMKERLYALGFAWNGQVYLAPYGERVGEEMVLTMSDQQFVEYADKCEKLLEAHTKAEAAKTEEADRVAQVAEEQRIRGEQQAAKELELNERLNKHRADELVALGMYRKPNGDNVYLTEDGGGYTYPVSQLHAFEDWLAETGRVKHLVGERDEAAKKARIAAERQTILDNRVKCLKAVGYEEMDGKLWLQLPDEGEAQVSYSQEIGDVLIDMPQDVYEQRLAKGEEELERRRGIEEERLRKEGEEREQKRLYNERLVHRIESMQGLGFRWEKEREAWVFLEFVAYQNKVGELDDAGWMRANLKWLEAAKAEVQRRAEEKRQRAEARKSDQQKAQDYLKAITDIPAPDLTDEEIKVAIALVYDAIDKAITVIKTPQAQ